MGGSSFGSPAARP